MIEVVKLATPAERKMVMHRAAALAGLEIIEAQEEFPRAVFDDIGAVVYYLKAISWQIKGFDPQAYLPRPASNERIEREGPLLVRDHRFFIQAKK